MKRLALFLCFLAFLGLSLVAVFVPAVSACMPLDENMAPCDRSVLVRPRVVLVPTKAPVAVAAAVPNPKRGTSPSDAMEPSDTWQTIAANSSLWFRIGEDSLNRVHLDVWLDANGKGNSARG